jgi:hypothetical protein
MEVLNAAYLPGRRGGEKDLLLHVDADDASGLLECMGKKGLEAEQRQR